MITKNTILFNAGGGLAMLIVGGYFVRGAIYPEKAPSCSTVYSALTELPLERSGGDLFTAADLQARLAGRDQGVLDHSRVVRVKGMQGAVLEVSLPKGSLGPRHGGPINGGVAFQWRPSKIDQAAAVCLSYSVWLPDDFDFKRGGTLPGVYGAADGGRGDERTAFAARYMWRESGGVDILATLPHNGESRTSPLNSDAFRLPRGQWIKIEQELVLNTPGQKDGAIRVWVDGRLVVDRSEVTLRDNASVTFAGVQADVHYGGSDSAFSAPKDTRIQLTPFEVRTR